MDIIVLDDILVMAIVLSIILLNVILMIVCLMNVILLYFTLLNVILLNVTAEFHSAKYNFSECNSTYADLLSVFLHSVFMLKVNAPS
jgi:hypothetical protein